MKKALIAGAASTVLAAMPVMGVFAEGTFYGTPVVDTLAPTVTEVCTLSRNATGNPSDNGHPAGTGDTAATATWAQGQVVTGDLTDGKINNQTVGTGASKDTASANVIAGSVYNNFAKSSFSVVCNNVAGAYAVTAYPAAAFSGPNGAATWSYAAGGTNYAESTATATSAWTLDSTNERKDLANGIVWSVPADSGYTTGTFDITYKLAVGITQKTGPYSTNIVYVLSDAQ